MEHSTNRCSKSLARARHQKLQCTINGAASHPGFHATVLWMSMKAFCNQSYQLEYNVAKTTINSLHILIFQSTYHNQKLLHLFSCLLASSPLPSRREYLFSLEQRSCLRVQCRIPGTPKSADPLWELHK